MLPSAAALGDARGDTLEEIPGMGPHTAQNVVRWFANPRNRELIDKLARAGVQVSRAPDAARGAASPDQETDQPLSGKTLVITGTLPTLSRSEATALIEAHGGRVTGSVSSKTDYLLCGEKAGSKRAKAEQLGVPIIDEQGLREMVGEI